MRKTIDDIRAMVYADLMASGIENIDSPEAVDEVKLCIRETLGALRLEGYIIPEPEIRVDGSHVWFSFPMGEFPGLGKLSNKGQKR